ncbi:hypothetical protein HW132_21675 [Brasilonema sp. CT11]|nr:hypothetical protein [Brasilonema sp. CT11]
MKFNEDDKAWHYVAVEQLLKGYSEEDAIYDTDSKNHLPISPPLYC